MHSLTVVQRVNGVYHELQQPVPEVAARVQHGDAGVRPRVLAGHHARHRRARNAGLRERRTEVSRKELVRDAMYREEI